MAKLISCIFFVIKFCPEPAHAVTFYWSRDETTWLFLWYPLFQLQLDRCYQHYHQTSNYSLKEYVPFSYGATLMHRLLKEKLKEANPVQYHLLLYRLCWRDDEHSWYSKVYPLSVEKHVH